MKKSNKVYDIPKYTTSQKMKNRRISEVMPIYPEINKLCLKGNHEIENLLINNQESISYNNINILKNDLPNIVNNINSIEPGNNTKIPTGKSMEGKKISHYSRNLDNFNNSLGDINNIDKSQFKTSIHLRRLTHNKINKYNYNDNDNENDNNNNSMNISQLVWKKSKNMGFVGSSKNKNSRNIDNIHMNKSNFLTHNNINTFTTKNSNNEKIKYTVNKKVLMNTIKKPSKIKLEKKDIKYKIPLELMNNFANKKKLEIEHKGEPNNHRKLNIKKYNINNIINNRSFSNIKKNKNNVEYQIQNNQNNDSKSFIESTLVAFNGLVSKAQQIGQILIDNKEMINANKENDLISNKLKNSLEILNMDEKIDKLNKKIKNEHNTVEELQKINLDLNNKINLFNENSQQYEYKVKELVNVINQLKQNINNNNESNNNSNNGNGYNNYNGTENKNLFQNESINKYIPSNNNNNFTLERKPKRKKIKFGFVESIFMKPDKFQIISKKKPNENNAIIDINKIKKDPKLIIVNMNNNNLNQNNKYDDKNITIEDYKDAASQIANHLLIESLMSLENEDDN